MHSAPLELEPQGEAGNADRQGKVKKTRRGKVAKTRKHKVKKPQINLKEEEKELKKDGEESCGRPEQVNEEVSASLAPNGSPDGKQIVG